MAIEYLVVKQNVIPSGPGLELLANLTCWPEGLPHTSENEVINIDRMYYVKRNVAGKTTSQLIDEAEIKIVVDLQSIIDDYNTGQTILNSVKVTSLFSNINGGLSG